VINEKTRAQNTQPLPVCERMNYKSMFNLQSTSKPSINSLPDRLMPSQ